MGELVTTQAVAQPAPPTQVANGNILQRKCACGTYGEGGECGKCRNEDKKLQRKANASAGPSGLPSIVHDVLESSGRPLDRATRAFFEPRFGYDFTKVRVHTDGSAAESARAVNAVAYTVGDDVVFDSGRYAAQTLNGNQLLAHELTHVVQQSKTDKSTGQASKAISEPFDAAEIEADTVANRITSGDSIRVQQFYAPSRSRELFSSPESAPERDADNIATGKGNGGPTPMIDESRSHFQLRPHIAVMRKIRADRAGDPAPGPPAAAGKQPLRAQVLEDYLRRLSPDGAPTVDRASGDVSLSGKFCRKRGLWERIGRGIVSGAKTGAGIGLWAFVVGAIPGAIIGGLIGGIAGIFGSDSQAEESSKPTGSTCICDLVNSKNTWTIHIHDFPTPLNIGGSNVRQPVTSGLDRQRKQGLIVVPSPNGSQIFGAATMSGQLQNAEPWLILGHELCGHAWLQDRQRDSADEEGIVEGKHLRHHRSVLRENLIRKEQGLEARGFGLKDPFCGESFSRPLGTPHAPPQFDFSNDEASRQDLIKQGKIDKAKETRLDECQAAREKAFPQEARRYKVNERIP